MLYIDVSLINIFPGLRLRGVIVNQNPHVNLARQHYPDHVTNIWQISEGEFRFDVEVSK